MTVFVDTSAFYALLARSDAHHAEAAPRWRELIGDRAVRLFTSNYVVVETCALLNGRLGRGAVADFCRALLPVTTVLSVDEATHRAAMEAMLLAGADGPSLVDCASLAVMHSRGIGQAFSYARHVAAGP